MKLSLFHLAVRTLPTVVSKQQISFDKVISLNFENYLRSNYNRQTIYDTLSYARRHGHILNDNSKTQELLASPNGSFQAFDVRAGGGCCSPL